MTDPAAVADAIDDRLRPLSVDVSHAWWDANVDSTDAHQARRVEAELALSEVLSDTELFGGIRAALDQEPDGLVRRRLELLHDAFLPRQVEARLRARVIELEASVESRYSRHRGVVGGRPVSDNEIKRILRTSDDVVLRQEAWEASKTVGAAVADDVRELARLRNEAARSLGHRDWFALSVATSEMDEAKLLATLDEADGVTAGPFAAWKDAVDVRLGERFGLAVGDLRPWHYADPFFQEVPVEGGVDLDPYLAGADLVELTRRTYDGLGLDVDPILQRSDLFPRDGKCQHAFCLDLDRAGDIRVLANVVPDQYWMDTMLHELGHGVYDAGFDADLPWLLRDCHLVVTEGIAILMGRQASEPDWLQHVAGVAGAEAADLARALRAARAAELAVFTRWVLVMTNFERSLYGDPDGDLDACWWDLVERYQLVQRPDGRAAPDWAAKIHVALAPVYYHTYLYGQLVASQLAETLERECGGIVGRPGAGQLLADRVFRPGLSLRWDRLVERATGTPLSAAAFERDVYGSS
jgi:peptidyl-dipeptidase A